MSLDLKRVEKVRELANGVVQARCPACAESGGDRKGEHLRVYPDGRFGCCVHPQDREHRRRIHALAGNKAPRVIRVRIAAPKSAGNVQGGILGRLGRVFGSPTGGQSGVEDNLGRLGRGNESPTEADGQVSGSDASDGVPQLQLRPVEPPRTPRTGVSKSNQGAVDPSDNSRTLRTPLNTYRDRDLFFGDEEEEYVNVYKEFAPPVRSVREVGVGLEFAEGVRSVREGVAAVEPPKTAQPGVRLPFFTPDGTLSVPFDSPERYHWWKPGGDRLTVKETIAELRARQEEVEHGAEY